MQYTDDPVADFLAWDAEQEKRLQKLPRCELCDEHIQQECAVRIDNKWYCDDCLSEVREYIEVD